MDDKMNRAFSIVVTTILSLSILVMTAPVVACSMSMGVQCTQEYYTSHETFVNWGSFYNSEPGTINYRMTLTVYDPSGWVVDREEFSDEGYISSARHCLRTSPPSGGWEPGTYEFRNSVFAYNSYGYTYSGSGDCTFTVLPDKPDLVITDVWNDNSTVYYKIKNVGGKKAGLSNTSLTADGVFVASDSVAPLNSMVERTERFDYIWNCTEINDIIEICADYTNDLSEADESNNCRNETLTCVPLIWVNPTSLDVTLPPHAVSDYTLTIGNSGNGAFTFNITDVPSTPSQRGWPITTCGWVASSPALGDIDGDGYPEVVVGSTDGMVYAWHHNGSNVTGWPRETGRVVYSSSPALGDIDGDGDIEVVVGSYKGVYAWHHNGSNVTGWPKTTCGTVESSPALGDIDGDGSIDVVVGSNDGNVYAWHQDGSAVAGWPKMADGAVTSSPALGDIDGDGDIEVVVGSNDEVHAWHHDGYTVTGWPKMTGYLYYSSPALGDIDGDGDIEIVIGSDDGVHAWHHDGSNVTGWPKTGLYASTTSPALGDIDGDGDIEVVIGSDYGEVYVWHHDGSAVTGWPTTTDGMFGASPALGDIDGDGDIEVVIGSVDAMHVWHHDGSDAMTVTTGGWAECSYPALGDIDCDGDIEIVIGSDYGVHVRDCSGEYNPDNIEWGTFRHDVMRTGLYGYTPPEVGLLSEDPTTGTVAAGGQTAVTTTDWLSEDPTTGTVNPCTQTNVTVTFDTTDLGVGEYSADILITSNYPDRTPIIVPIPVRLTVTIPQSLDLVIIDVWNDCDTIYYKMKNVGAKKAEASSTSLTVDGVFEASDSVGPLNSTEEMIGSFDYRWNCTGEDDTITVCADHADDVAESDENNNCRTETWTCKPDLVITDVWDDCSTIHYTIKNVGDKKAEASNTSLTVDGVFEAFDSIGPLDPMEEKNGSFDYRWNCTNPSDMIWVCADYTDNVPESNENNNCQTEALACPSPDIRVNPTSFDVKLPPDVVSNRTLTIGNDGRGVLEFNVSDAIASDTTAHANPQVGWPKRTGDKVQSSPALADIDGDGDIEVVVSSYDKKVHAWHHDGSTVAGWPETTDGKMWSSPALGDIDGDGDIEVVVGSYKKVYAWHHDSSTVAGWPKTAGGWVESTPALGDIDGDGDVEVVVGSDDKKVYAWHHDGSAVAGWPKTTGGSMYSYSSPALGDIDGDGDIEVVIGSGDGVHAWHHDGSTVAGWPKTTATVLSSPALGDIDGDGDIEIVVGSMDGKVHALHHDGSTVAGWPRTTDSIVISSPSLGDIDCDGDIEIVVGSYDKKVYAWHHDGSIVAGWPRTTDGAVISSPLLGDIDGDGDIEVVVASCGDKVYAYHDDGSAVTGWPRTTGSCAWSSPALGDIDCDGDIEVVIGSNDGKVYAWDCSGTYDPDNIEWGRFRHDVRHTGLYEAMPPKPPNKKNWLSESPTTGTVDPDSQTDITVTFNTAGLPFGNYTANITITSNDPAESQIILPVRLTVTTSQKGDLNHDGTLTTADAAIALVIAATGAQNPAADVSGDHRVTSLDALMILQAAAGAIEL